jgi:transcriptional regulator with XRE-family HTH domain
MTESNILIAFSDNLRRLCEARGLSANELAKRAGIPRRNVFRYLACETIPRAKYLAELCNALCCDPSDLYGGAK